MSDTPFYNYGRQTIEDDDVAAVAEALRHDYLTTGPGVDAFEAAVAEWTGVAEAVAVNSGTAALHVAYAAAGVGPGTEIITSPITFVATTNVALHLGAKVVFADVDPETGILDPDAVATLVNERTKAIVPVDLAGVPAPYGAFDALRRDGLHVLGDSSHSIGATLDGVQVGKLCEAATISLHPVKTITAGEGGLVLTDDAEWAHAMRRFRHHGIDRVADHPLADEGPWAYSMTELGQNYRLTDFQCALGISQLKKLDRFLARRREIAAHYDAAFADLESFATPKVPAGADPAWHLYPLRVADPQRRRAFFDKLRELRIGAQIHYIPVYWQPYYQGLGFERGLCPHAEDYYSRIVSIPMYPSLSDDDLAEIVRRIRAAADAVL